MFNRKCSIIGVVHLLPLPGAAGYGGCIDDIASIALDEAATYTQHGVDALILENMHDAPYLRGRVEAETTAAMAVIAARVKESTRIPVGVQILAGANLEALGVAVAAGLDFVRVEGFVFAHVGDEGVHEACAAELVRRRAALKAGSVRIFADIKKKHSAHAITADVSLAETAAAAEFFKADGVVISGSHTGVAPDPQSVIAARDAVTIPVLVGSGVSVRNVDSFYGVADALIVGSSFKDGGRWSNPVEPGRVADFIHRCRELESGSIR